MNRFEELKTLILSLEDEFHKFYEKENKAAGTRVRKGMQTLKKIAQEIRAHVSESKASKDDLKGSDGKQV
ncbi:histone H1 [Cardinium endosymbiont of Nabis limbatus]|uniref:histone H1 n=1 Tax=Cardinium endosymbiont of Nabis limbatus TaxID=3066217 RepID=UPI003AF331B7